MDRKVLVLSDASCGITGFSQVIQNILASLHKEGYKIVQVGINYDGEGYDVQKFPYKILPATSGMNPRYNDVYGRGRFMDILKEGQVDIAFILQDPAVIASFSLEMQKIYDELPKNKKFTTVVYCPVDSDLSTKKKWVTGSVSMMDFPVVYTEWGRKQMVQHDDKLAKRLDVCYHGVDTYKFFPMDKADAAEKAKKIWGTSIDFEGKFILLNVNRNQIRKDYVKTFKVFAEFKKAHPNALLLAYAALRDQGGDLVEIAEQCGLTYGKDWIAPANYTSLRGVPIETMNVLYNMSDCVMSTTIGEGFGLSTVEALATKRPCVFPDNSALTEIFGGDGIRGRLAASGNKPDNFVCYGVNDSSLVRPTVDVEDMVAKLDWVYQGGPEVTEMVERGYAWVQGYDWSVVNRFWIKKFDDAYKHCMRTRGISAS